jgi:hypothetical protein
VTASLDGGRAVRSIARVSVIAGLCLALGFGCTVRRDGHEGESPNEAEESGPHFGDRMDGIGRRFERLGRAGMAGRWEFAAYEVDELRESFEELERVPVPEEELGNLDVADLVRALVASALPGVDSAVARQDSAAFRAAFRQVAQECNDCHHRAKRPFVQVPEVPGEAVPMLTPMRRGGSAATPR